MSGGNVTENVDSGEEKEFAPLLTMPQIYVKTQGKGW